MFQRPERTEYAPFYESYVSAVEDADVLSTLENNLPQTLSVLLSEVARERSAFRYAAGKWSLVEVVGHMTDLERVMSYRALRFARGDSTALPGFDENRYTPQGRFDRFPLEMLTDDLTKVRQATLSLLRSFTHEAWNRGGKAAGAYVTVRGLAYIIAGHEIHHRKVIEERYLAS